MKMSSYQTSDVMQLAFNYDHPETFDVSFNKGGALPVIAEDEEPQCPKPSYEDEDDDFYAGRFDQFDDNGVCDFEDDDEYADFGDSLSDGLNAAIGGLDAFQIAPTRDLSDDDLIPELAASASLSPCYENSRRDKATWIELEDECDDDYSGEYACALYSCEDAASDILKRGNTSRLMTLKDTVYAGRVKK
eukprot:CAMPEP_0118700984 /NCGR_PEP_ID=MMETSP0800-20121206/16946_1 /TAXON_ID=210618 ORGANISM="Striatella unipunctata, Strain CCMP2910" /NCGR_SAMPLE_ID=MMETSP0800 /ASSEMBLY_ACC=CAM_ASM_000638 /LENGTH=189 /DNA_ID=CAMNT_0006601749 /DNA_START=173 /DNA_END=742 /DNA_ORIENTATION=+